MTLTCFDVADYFLAKTEEDAGDTISNLKLQKLVYYAQGFALAILGHALFEEKIEAWQHGPVVPELYQKYKSYGAGGIPMPEHVDYSKFSKEVQKLLDDVYYVYGQFSAWKLRNMTHEETPWKTTANNATIPLPVMQDYFKTLVDGQR